MKKAILEIYSLAVCFFTVICFVVTSGLLIWHFVEVAAPEFTISKRDYKCYQSNEAYNDCFHKKEPLTEGPALTTKRTEGYKLQIKLERRQAVQGIAQKLIVALVCVLFFFLHWSLAKRSRADQDKLQD